MQSPPLEELEQVCGREDVIALQEAVHGIYVDVLIKQYIVALTDATRNHDSVYLGASPRGSLALQRLCPARALLCRPARRGARSAPAVRGASPASQTKPDPALRRRRLRHHAGAGRGQRLLVV